MPNALKAFLMSLGSGQLDLTAPYYRAMDAALRRRLMEQKQRQFDVTLPIRQSQADAAMMGARTSAGKLGFDQQKYAEAPGRQEKKHQQRLTEIQAYDLDPQAIAEMRGDVGPPPSVGKLQEDVARRRAEGRREVEEIKTYGAGKRAAFRPDPYSIIRARGEESVRVAGEKAKLRKDPQVEIRKRMYEQRYYKLEQDLANLDKIVAAGRAKGEDWPEASEIRKAAGPLREALRRAAETGEYVPIVDPVQPTAPAQSQQQQAPSIAPAGKPTISRGQAKEIMDQLIQAGTAPDYDTAAAMVDQAYTIQKE